MSLFEKGKKHYISTATKGLFFIIPIAAIIAIIVWLYKKVDILTGEMFKLVGLVPEHNMFLWTMLGIVIMATLIYIVGILENRLEKHLKKLLYKVPGYKTIKDLVNIFNSSKEGDSNVLVVAVKGLSGSGYNIGLMYSTKESVFSDYYSVTISQTPLPNGGYIVEEHSDEIYVFPEAQFDDMLQYLLSMGTKSFSEIANIPPVRVEEMLTLTQYFKEKKETKRVGREIQ